MSNSNVLKQFYKITKVDRALKKQQQPMCIWFTGLSGSGKSSLIDALEVYLHMKNYHTYVLDGDNLRNGLCDDLSFSNKDRDENLRRAGEVARLMVDAGLIILAGFISPTRKQREKIRGLFPTNEFCEIYLSTPLEVCEIRDVKGLYDKARKGEIKNFTGISSSYEPPCNPKITLDTSKDSIEESLNKIIALLKL